MQLKEILQKTSEFFKAKGVESPRLDAELLIGKVLGLSRVQLYLKFDYPLKEDELNASRELVRRRAAGEPVAYILGEKEFFKSTFLVNKDVLIPRPETEELVEAALGFAYEHTPALTMQKSRLTPLGGENPALKKNIDATESTTSQSETVEGVVQQDGVFRIVDLGTGSGCIGLSLLKELPKARLLTIDLSEGAVQVARKNAAALQVQERATFLQGDAGELSVDDVDEYLLGLADMVVANPPYISNNDLNVSPSVRAHEPAIALFAGHEGLREIERWAKVAGQVARRGAFVMFEIGADQGQKAREIFSNTEKFERIEIVKDLSGRDRFIRCFKSE